MESDSRADKTVKQAVGPPELLPCPFCGRDSLELTDQYDEDGRWIVLCLGCKTGSAFCMERSRAIEAWNTRTTRSVRESAAAAPVGTTNCPICGNGIPHNHADKEIVEYRFAQGVRASDRCPCCATGDTREPSQLLTLAEFPKKSGEIKAEWCRCCCHDIADHIAAPVPSRDDTVPCPCCKKPLVGAGGLCTNCWEAHNRRATSAPREADSIRRKALEEAAQEADRFLESLKGRNNDRADGAFVAITRLARNIRSLARDTTPTDEEG